MDHYERTTQLKPVAATLAPISVLVVSCFRAQTFEDATRSLILVGLAAGFHLVAMRKVRDRGNTVQTTLWEDWGGNPTAQRLRWSGGSISAIERLHRRVQHMTGVTLPTRAEEELDPTDADEVYLDSVAQMRERTRDKERYPRVYAELVQYGTARNFYGLRRFALSIAAIVLTLSVLGIIAGSIGLAGWPLWPLVVSSISSALIAAAWISIITHQYVRVAAERYADALLATAEEPPLTV